ncbi:hypothetical protein HYFRA_00009368 [Hymenoscyphus fraxineus]|uniref:Uncharacterized protein n=1 Tax=Hymenoscyphus fraxineus TaxID=746836 RepID=A0A9N9L412_9HELO|nr:hypothetical protein HYFRA_00009368 [Hymenoscyphus fraxineus]
MTRFHSFTSAILPLVIFCLTAPSLGESLSSHRTISTQEPISVPTAVSTSSKPLFTRPPVRQGEPGRNPDAPHAIIETSGLVPVTADGPAVSIASPIAVATSTPTPTKRPTLGPPAPYHISADDELVPTAPDGPPVSNTAIVSNPTPPVEVPSPNTNPPPQPPNNNPQPINGPPSKSPPSNEPQPVNESVPNNPPPKVNGTPVMIPPSNNPISENVTPVVNGLSSPNSPSQDNPGESDPIPSPYAVLPANKEIPSNGDPGLPSVIHSPGNAAGASNPVNDNTSPPPNNVQPGQDKPSVPIAAATYDSGIVPAVTGEKNAPPAFILPGGSTLQPGQIFTAAPIVPGGNSIIISLAPVPTNAAQNGVPVHNLVISTLNAPSATTITPPSFLNPQNPGANPAITSFPVAKTIVYNSQTLVMGGPIATLADKNAVASYGSQGVVVQYPSGSVSSIPLSASQPKTTSGVVFGNKNSAAVGTLMTSIVSGGSISNSTVSQSATRTSVVAQVTEKPSSPPSEGKIPAAASGKAPSKNGCGKTVVGGFSGLKWGLVPVLVFASLL